VTSAETDCFDRAGSRVLGRVVWIDPAQSLLFIQIGFSEENPLRPIRRVPLSLPRSPLGLGETFNSGGGGAGDAELVRSEKLGPRRSSGDGDLDQGRMAVAMAVILVELGWDRSEEMAATEEQW